MRACVPWPNPVIPIVFMTDNNEASIERYIIIFSLRISAVYLLQMFGKAVRVIPRSSCY